MKSAGFCSRRLSSTLPSAVAAASISAPVTDPSTNDWHHQWLPVQQWFEPGTAMHYMDTVTVHDSTKWSCHGQYQCHAWVILVTDTTDCGLASQDWLHHKHQFSLTRSTDTSIKPQYLSQYQWLNKYLETTVVHHLGYASWNIQDFLWQHLLGLD